MDPLMNSSAKSVTAPHCYTEWQPAPSPSIILRGISTLPGTFFFVCFSEPEAGVFFFLFKSFLITFLRWRRRLIPLDVTGRRPLCRGDGCLLQISEERRGRVRRRSCTHYGRRWRVWNRSAGSAPTALRRSRLTRVLPEPLGTVSAWRGTILGSAAFYCSITNQSLRSIEYQNTGIVELFCVANS